MVNRPAVAVVVIVLIAAGAYFLLYQPGGVNTSTQSSASKGKMAVMATDPPMSSGGTSKEYEHYNNIAAHKAPSSQQTTTSSSTTSTAQGSSSGWVLLNASGTIELSSLVNSSQTIALASIDAATYDSVRLYVDSAIVTYNGQNYTATVESGQVTGNIQGDAQVSSSATAAVLIDLRTVVVNTGTSSSPQFFIGSSARVTTVPSSDVTSASIQVGARTDLSAKAWFQTFVAGNAHLEITGASLSAGALTVSVKNSGSETANVTLVIVTPVSASATILLPATISGSAVFTVSAGGSLQGASSAAASTIFGSAGAQIASSASTDFSYAGTITFGGVLPGATVQTGQYYLITVLGSNSAASTVVVAG